MPYPAWDLVPLDVLPLPLVNRPYVIVETSRGCPYSCDFCVAPIHQGHKFRERSAEGARRRIERSYREFGIDFFYLWGDTVTLNVKTFTRVLRRAHRAEAADPVVRQRARRQPDRSGVRAPAAQSGCWMLALGIETESEDIRKDMVKRLERAEDPTAFRNMRDAGIKSFAFFIFGYPGETLETMDHTDHYAIELDPDFANFYPAVPYPGHGAVRRRPCGKAAVDERLVADGVFVLPDARQRAGRAHRHGRDQPRQAPLLPAAGLRDTPTRRRRQADGHQARHRAPGAWARALRDARAGAAAR